MFDGSHRAVTHSGRLTVRKAEAGGCPPPASDVYVLSRRGAAQEMEITPCLMASTTASVRALAFSLRRMDVT